MDKNYWHFFRKSVQWVSNRFDFWFAIVLNVVVTAIAAILSPWMLLLMVVPFGIMIHGIHSITKIEYDYYKETRREI